MENTSNTGTSAAGSFTHDASVRNLLRKVAPRAEDRLKLTGTEILWAVIVCLLVGMAAGAQQARQEMKAAKMGALYEHSSNQ